MTEPLTLNAAEEHIVRELREIAALEAALQQRLIPLLDSRTALDAEIARLQTGPEAFEIARRIEALVQQQILLTGVTP